MASTEHGICTSNSPTIGLHSSQTTAGRNKLYSNMERERCSCQVCNSLFKNKSVWTNSDLLLARWRGQTNMNNSTSAAKRPEQVNHDPNFATKIEPRTRIPLAQMSPTATTKIGIKNNDNDAAATTAVSQGC